MGVIVFPKNGKILARIVFIQNSENDQNRVTAKLNSEAKSKMAIPQKGLKWPTISKKSLPEGFWSKKVMEHAFLKSHILPQNLFVPTLASTTATWPFSWHKEPKIDFGSINLA